MGPSLSWQEAQQCTGRQSAIEGASSSASASADVRKKEWVGHWSWLELVKPQSPLPVTHFFLQCHTP